MSASPSEPVALESARQQAGQSFKSLLTELERRYPERGGVLQQAALALVAREHLLVFGPPGTGKSELASALLRRLVDDSGRPSLYSRQIVETTVQTDLVGPVDFKTLTETGRTVYHLDEGILNAEHAVLDEVFDGRDLLLRSILSVLNERELALGPVVHPARLQTAVLTTNRYLSEILNARPETLLAFTDRIAFACFVPKAFASPASRETVLRWAAEPPAEPPRTMPLSGLRLLRQAAREVKVGEDVRVALGSLVDVYGKLLQEATRERKGYAPSCFLSPRTLAKSVGVVRAGVVLGRYVERASPDSEPRPLRATVADLGRLRWMFALGGPPPDELARVVAATVDPKEKWQLENLRLEAGAFEQAFKVVLTDHQRREESEAKAVGLRELRAKRKALTPANAADFALQAAEARRQAQSEDLRTELKALVRDAALSFAEGARTGTLPQLPGGEKTSRLRACLELAQGLRDAGDTSSAARDLLRLGVTEAEGALLGLGTAEAGFEFVAGSPFSVVDLVERTVGVQRQLAAVEELGSALAALAGPGHTGRPLESVALETRRRVARTMRRRAMVLLGGRSREPKGWKDLAEAASRLVELDQALEQLCPGEGKVRSHVFSARAGLLLAAELEQVPVDGDPGRGLGPAAAQVQAGVERMEAMGVEPWRAMRVCRPILERQLEWLLQHLPTRPAPEGVPSEDGYQALLRGCRADAERAALHDLAGAALLKQNPLVLRLDARLAELDLHELSLQVNYLARWLDDVMAGVPEPGEISSLDQAEAVWAHVNATRFFAVGWRDRDLASLRERLGRLQARADVASEAARTLASLDAVAATADRFGRALLERRAELAVA